ncbi:hypothetical protein BOVMAS18_10620 [Streptococcus uberis]
MFKKSEKHKDPLGLFFVSLKTEERAKLHWTSFSCVLEIETTQAEGGGLFFSTPKNKEEWIRPGGSFFRDLENERVS